MQNWNEIKVGDRFYWNIQGTRPEKSKSYLFEVTEVKDTHLRLRGVHCAIITSFYQADLGDALTKEPKYPVREGRDDEEAER